MKALLWALVALLVGGQAFTIRELLEVRRVVDNTQQIEKARYKFLTSLHIYGLQERETLDILAKLTYARLNRIEGTRDLEGTIQKLDEQYERAQRTTEQEWELLRKNHPEEAKEFALQYEQWLRSRTLAGGDDKAK
jgi:hypothetical protein